MVFTPNVKPTFVRQPVFGLAALTTTAGAGSTFVTVYTGAASGSRIVGLSAIANTSASFFVRYALQRGGTSYYYATVTVPSGSGLGSGSPPVNMLTSTYCPSLPLDSNGNPFLVLQSSLDVLAVQVTNTSSLWAAGSFMRFAAMAEDF